MPLAPLAEPATGMELVPSNRPELRSTGPICSIARQLKGGKDEFMELAHLAVHIEPKYSVLVDAWEKLKPDGQNKLDLDNACKKLDIDPYHFLAVVSEAAMKFRDNASLILASMAMPQVIQSSIEFAQHKDGVSDRKMLMQHSGFLPMPKGATIMNNFNAQNNNSNEANPANTALPSFERTMDVIDAE